MKNGFILFVLFIALNIDVLFLVVYATKSENLNTEIVPASAVTVEDLDPLIDEVEPEPEPLETEPQALDLEVPDIADPLSESGEQTPRPDLMLTDIANFRQDERGWAYELLGGTGETMREYGCTVTSVANAMTNFSGEYVTPKVLNQNLIKVGAYTDRGWLIWSKISDATDGKYSATIYNTGDTANVDACLADNQYPVVKILLRGTVQHWVLVVGRKDGEYLIRDPLEGDRAERPIPLSRRADRIHSVRCIKEN